MAWTSLAAQSHPRPAMEQAKREQYTLPYFAHQVLNPKRYPKAVGLPVGGPSYGAVRPEALDGAVMDWEDGDDAAQFSCDGENAPDCYGQALTKRRRTSTTVLNGTSYKKMRITGGRPAIAKKVTADLDSDDDMIVRMKEAKYLEKDIAKTLADEGRIAYNPKTIGTRWARIRKALQKKQDEMLDAELTDWHDGDDDVLYEAIKKAEAEVERAKAAAEAKKWRIVADEMKAMKPVVNFSHNACRDRYDALLNGNAKPTPESNPNPDKKTLERIRSRQKRENKIAKDCEPDAFNRLETLNVKGNAWTSRPRDYFI